jgi:hypothetical protein
MCEDVRHSISDNLEENSFCQCHSEQLDQCHKHMQPPCELASLSSAACAMCIALCPYNLVTLYRYHFAALHRFRSNLSRILHI